MLVSKSWIRLKKLELLEIVLVGATARVLLCFDDQQARSFTTALVHDDVGINQTPIGAVSWIFELRATAQKTEVPT